MTNLMQSTGGKEAFWLGAGVPESLWMGSKSPGSLLHCSEPQLLGKKNSTCLIEWWKWRCDYNYQHKCNGSPASTENLFTRHNMWRWSSSSPVHSVLQQVPRDTAVFARPAVRSPWGPANIARSVSASQREQSIKSLNTDCAEEATQRTDA